MSDERMNEVQQKGLVLLLLIFIVYVLWRVTL